MTGASPSAERLSRLLALVPWLKAHDGTTIEKAADHFRITPEQLESDLWLLVCSGLPGHMPDQLVDIQFWEDDHRIDVIDAQTLSRPLRLTPDEAMCLLVGLRMLAQVPGDHDRESLISATAKLERAAGEAAADSELVAVAVEAPDDAAQVVEQAIVGLRALELTYAGAIRDEVTERVVDPMRTLVVDGRTYLEAWCRRAGAVRIFRLDRILAVRMLEQPAEPPADATHVVLGPEGFQMEGTTVTLELQPQARWVTEVHPVTTVEERPDGSLRIVVQAADVRWAVRMALSLGGTGRVVSPPEVVEAVRTAAREALQGRD